MNPSLLLLPGSQRRESYNTKLLQRLAQDLRGRCTLDWLNPSEVNLPLFNQDLEDDPVVRAKVAAVHRRIAACDGLVVASPEYNGQPTPYLKNIVDWVSRLAYIAPAYSNAFVDRPVLLCSASTGWTGGAVGLPPARALLRYVGCEVLPDVVCVPKVHDMWTPQGFAFDPFFDAHISVCCDALLSAASLLSQTPNLINDAPLNETRP